MGFSGGSEDNPPAMWETWVRSLGWEDPLPPWRRSWQPSLYSCLENPYGQSCLVGYRPWGHKGLDTTEQLSACTGTHTHTHTHTHTGILFSHKKWGNSTIYDNMNGPWGHFSKWNKPEIKSQILHGITCMWSLKKFKSNLQSQSRKVVAMG